MCIVVLREVHVHWQLCSLHKIIQVVSLAKKEHHVYWIVKPRRALSNVQKNHRKYVIGEYRFSRTGIRAQSILASVTPRRFCLLEL